MIISLPGPVLDEICPDTADGPYPPPLEMNLGACPEVFMIGILACSLIVGC